MPRTPATRDTSEHPSKQKLPSHTRESHNTEIQNIFHSYLVARLSFERSEAIVGPVHLAHAPFPWRHSQYTYGHAHLVVLVSPSRGKTRSARSPFPRLFPFSLPVDTPIVGYRSVSTKTRVLSNTVTFALPLPCHIQALVWLDSLGKLDRGV